MACSVDLPYDTTTPTCQPCSQPVADVKWAPPTGVPGASRFNLASASHDGSVKVWDMRSSVPLHTLPPPSTTDKKTKGAAAAAAAAAEAEAAKRNNIPAGPKVLCVDFWGAGVVFGGADRRLRSFALA